MKNMKQKNMRNRRKLESHDNFKPTLQNKEIPRMVSKSRTLHRYTSLKNSRPGEAFMKWLCLLFANFGTKQDTVYAATSIQ